MVLLAVVNVWKTDLLVGGDGGNKGPQRCYWCRVLLFSA